MRTLLNSVGLLLYMSDEGIDVSSTLFKLFFFTLPASLLFHSTVVVEEIVLLACHSGALFPAGV